MCGSSPRVSSPPSSGSSPSTATLDEAGPGRAVTVTTADPIDIGRGDILCSPDRPPDRAREFTATLVWMSESDLVAGRDYQLQQAGQRLRCRVTEPVRRPRHRHAHLGARARHETQRHCLGHAANRRRAHVRTRTSRTGPVGRSSSSTQADNATVAAGMIKAATRAAHIVPSAGRVSPETRAQLLGHGALTVWFTGLPGSGKSTLARAAEAELAAAGVFACVLDGDNLRFGLNADLGFSPEDRAENIRRAGEVAALLHRYGAVVLAAFISPLPPGPRPGEEPASRGRPHGGVRGTRRSTFARHATPRASTPRREPAPSPT